jgi:hypothetical protein
MRKEMEDQVQEMLRKAVIEECIPVEFSHNSRTEEIAGRYAEIQVLCGLPCTECSNTIRPLPLPLLEKSVSMLHGSKYFAVLDCCTGFWKIKIAEEDELKTAF